MGLLNLALLPGEGLGPFKLGAELHSVLELLASQRATYPCVEISQPSRSQDIELRLPDHGFSLQFEPAAQRLRLASVTDASRLLLRCGPAAVFGGAANLPTYVGVYQAFGPTNMADASLADAAGPAAGLHSLVYPGLLILFSAVAPTAAAAALPAGGQAAAAAALIPLDSPAVRLCVFAGAAGTAAQALAAPPPPLPPGEDYMARVEAIPGEGLYFCAGRRSVRLGDSPQEVVSELGEPEAVHLKSADAAGGDYFYNYFRRGLDVLFCGREHAVKKLVLHANATVHPDFGLYRRCNFRLHVGTKCTLAHCADGGHATAPPGADAGELDPAGSADAALEREQRSADGGTSGEEVAGPQRVGRPLSTPYAAYAMDTIFAVDSETEPAAAAGDNGGAAKPKKRRNKRNGRPPRPPPAPVPAPAPPSARQEPSSVYPPLYTPPQESPPPRGSPWVLGGSTSPSPGTSPSGRPASLLARHGGGPRGPGSLGSAGSSLADLVAKEERLETGSQYYDGWSDADELSALVTQADAAAGREGASDGEDACAPAANGKAPRVSAGVQTAEVPSDADEGEAWGGDGGAAFEPGAADEDGLDGSPQSFVSVDEHSTFDPRADSAFFETVPRLRTCSTQTSPPLRPPPAVAHAAAKAAAAAHAAAPAAEERSGAVVTVLDDLAAVEAAFGGLGAPAMHPRMGAGPATQLYGFPEVVFEVLPDGGIATLTLFQQGKA